MIVQLLPLSGQVLLTPIKMSTPKLITVSRAGSDIIQEIHPGTKWQVQGILNKAKILSKDEIIK